MKKNVITGVSNRKVHLSAGQSRLKAGQVNENNAEAPVETVTFKGGLRDMNIKYAHSHSAYIPLHRWSETGVAAAAGAWLTAFRRSKRCNLCLSGCTIRLIRNVLEERIRKEGLLYVMNAYIYGVINTASIADALCITHDYEDYITHNKTVTASQKKILLRGFAAAKCSFNFMKDA